MDQLIGQWVGDRTTVDLQAPAQKPANGPKNEPKNELIRVPAQGHSHSRYQIESLLGKQTGRRTYLATDSETGDRVVVKLVLFGPDFTWADLRLFEREAETLKSLDHEAIPRYLDSFEVETPMGKGFALVQPYIDAKSLQQWVKAGRTFSEGDLSAIATRLLNILNYLHHRHPPVIHRDIKPSNVLLTIHRDGRLGALYLIDFGSVQTTPSSGTMTVVGTYGYMPIEQFGGRALPASDLYSLGATLLFLATGQHPADLTQANLQIEFDQHVSFTPGFSAWIKQLTYADLSRRTPSAAQALNALNRAQAKPQFTSHGPSHGFSLSHGLSHSLSHGPSHGLSHGLSLSHPTAALSTPLHNFNDIEIFSTPERISIQLFQTRLIEKKSVDYVIPFFLCTFGVILLIYAFSMEELSMLFIVEAFIWIGGLFFFWFAMLMPRLYPGSNPKKEFKAYKKTTLHLWLSAHGSMFLSCSPSSLSNGRDVYQKSLEASASSVRFPLKAIKVRPSIQQIQFLLGYNDYVNTKLCIRGSRQEIQFLCRYLSQYSNIPHSHISVER